MKPIVYVDRLSGDGERLVEQIYSASEATGLLERAQTARSVLIKPNLTYPVYKEGVTTRVEFVEALVRVMKRANPDLGIIIAEGEGGYNSFSMSEAMRSMGFERIVAEHSGVRLVNLSERDRRSVTLETKRGPYPIELADIFEEIDFAVCCPLPKIHSMTTVTLSLKNLWGCLPDTMRLRNHYMLPHILSLLVKELKFDFAFLDGKFGLDNNGPMSGDVVQVDWFAASNSLGALDQVVSGMMGQRWKSIRHLRIAHDYGVVPDEDSVEIIGDEQGLSHRFDLKRSSWNYPALAAFHSKFLTQLFYLSKLSGPLHDIMYMFRKRDISEDFNRPSSL